MMVNKFENLINDEAFISKLENAKNDDELIALFKANGVKITIEEIKEMMRGGNTEELNEESLDTVSGGAIGYIVGYTVARWLKNRSSQGGGGGAFGGGVIGSR